MKPYNEAMSGVLPSFVRAFTSAPQSIMYRIVSNLIASIRQTLSAKWRGVSPDLVRVDIRASANQCLHHLNIVLGRGGMNR